MFGWLRKKKPKIESEPTAPVGWDPCGTILPLTVMHVVDQFLQQNPAPTPFVVHALIKAGATELMTPAEVLQVCEKIQQHGYQYPLNPTLRTELTEDELFDFLRWQARSDVAVEAYQNENTIRHLIERFRSETVY